MALGSYYDPNERYRRRASQRFLALIKVLVLCFIIGGAGFYLGILKTSKDIHILEEQKNLAQKQLKEMREDLTKLRAEASTANIRLGQLRASFDEVLPEGPMQDLVLLLKKQIDEGIDAKRLEKVILSARPPQNCSEPKSKRFVLTTPAYKGPESRVLIDGGKIIIYGKGKSARNAKGKPEAWFDPSRTVELSFKQQNQDVEVRKGYLPLYHSVIIENKEYRFTVAKGKQSFAKVTYDVCDYP